MKKLVSVFLAGLMAFSLSMAMDASALKEKMSFPEPQILHGTSYSYVIMENANYMRDEGYPLLPYYTKSYTFPLGTKIKDVSVNVEGIEHLTFENKIAPSPPATPRGDERIYEPREGSIYGVNAYYPEKWYDYHIGVGLYKGERSIILSIYLYPLKYNPVRNDAIYARNFEINVEYEKGRAMVTADSYDLLIVAPEKFVDELQPFKEHKEKHGIKTIIETVEDIKSSYSGRDDAEKVKYAIKDAIEEYGIKYVLLAGGLSSPIKSDTWLVPVRYSHLDDGAENRYLTDLYFADIYKYEDGNVVFDDWDSNGNGIFAEWRMTGKDVLDMYPDVYIGRLACRSEQEMTDMVNKIIYYEENTHGSDWFHRAILVGGDTFDDTSGDNFYEGEVATEKFWENLGSDFEKVKVWYSEGNLKQSNVIDAINQGGGFLHFSGHGSPGMWMGKEFSGGKAKYILGLDIFHMPFLKNEGMYPVTIIGGCHNSMFNATLYDSVSEIIKSIIFKYIMGKHFTTWYWAPVPECFGWFIVRQPSGGAIASMGCTGLGYGTIGDTDKDGIPDCIQYLLGWAEVHFAEVYANGTDMLGMTHSTVLTDYLNRFDCQKRQTDAKTVQEWVLLGDPTLKIGGYE